MTWIWPGDVCVRSSRPSTSTYSVSHRSRAGWSGGMLSIWKLRTSSSISGPSYVTNPNCPKIAAISAMVSLMGWSVPRRIARPGVVTSTRSALSRAGWSRARPGRFDRGPDIVRDGAHPWAILAGERADAAQDAGQAPLLAEDVEFDGLEGGDVLARGDG